MQVDSRRYVNGCSHAALVIAVLSASLVAGRACADDGAPVPPPHTAIDENGVDLSTGNYAFTENVLTVGSGPTALALSRVYAGKAYRYSVSGTINEDPIQGGIIVSIGTFSERFESNDIKNGPFYPSEASGSSLVVDPTTFTYTRRDGTTAVYLKSLGNSLPDVGAQGRMTQLTTPNGIAISFVHTTQSTCVPLGSGCYSTTRDVLHKASSNAGFMIQMPDIGTKGFNLTVDTCDTGPGSCSSAVAPIPVRTDLTTVTYDDASKALTRTWPTGKTATYALDLNGRVTSVSSAGASWTYAYTSTHPVVDHPEYTGLQVVVTDPVGHTRTVNTTGDYLASDTDALGHTISYKYDPWNRVSQIIYPEGNYDSYAYDSRGNVTERRQVSKLGTSAADLVTTANYDATCTNIKTCNQPNWIKDPKGNVTNYTYAPEHGGVLTITRPASASGVQPQIRNTYQQYYARYKNGSGSLVRAATPIWLLASTSTCATGVASSCLGTADETVTTTGYGSASGPNNLLPISGTVSAGDGTLAATTTTTYDAAGNPTSVDGPLPNTSTSTDVTVTRYDANRRVVGVIKPGAINYLGTLTYRATKITYTNDGLTALTENGTVPSQSDTDWTSNFTSLEREVSDYDAANRLVRTRVTAGSTSFNLTEYSFDAAGRLLCTALRLNPAATALTDACTPVSGTDRITRNDYDSKNRITGVTSGYQTSDVSKELRTYTVNGKPDTFTDADNNQTKYLYDEFDRLTRIQYPRYASGSGLSNANNYTTFGYDPAGNVTSRRLRDGQSYTISYDALNRETSRTSTGATHAYDNLGRPTSLSGGGQTVAVVYDALGRVKSQSTALGVVKYEYDLAGHRTKLIWPDAFFINYDYDATGEVTAIRENGATSGTGILASFKYNNRGDRYSTVRSGSSTTVYGRDVDDRVNKLRHTLPGTLNDQTVNLTYNAADEILTKTSVNDAWVQAPPNSNVDQYASNGLNQITSVNGAAFDYNNRGDLTSDGANTYFYDIENNLTKISGSKNVTLGYDPLGNLFQVVSGTSTTRFLYDGDDLIAEFDGNNSLIRRYVHGPGADEPMIWYEGAGNNNRRWLIPDQQGSINAVTDDSGTVLGLNTFDEFGTPGTNNIGRFQYVGQMWLPEAGLYDFKARAYSPYLGRFMQPDPAGYEDGLNWYAYVGNNPVNDSDPSGLGQDDPPPPPPNDELVVTGTRQHYADFWDGIDAWENNHPNLNLAIDLIPYVGTAKAAYDFGRHPGVGTGLNLLLSVVPIPGAKLVGKLAERAGGKLLGKVLGRAVSNGCFVAGTLIQTEEGAKPIEDVKVGEMVLSRDEISGKTTYKQVVAVLPQFEQQIFEVQVKRAGSSQAEVIKTTKEHPFRVGGRWVPANELAHGQALETADGATSLVVGVVATQRLERTYNFEVAHNHTFFVGADKVLVHNNCNSEGKRILLDMFKTDFRKGGNKMSEEDFNAYKQLNDELPDADTEARIDWSGKSTNVPYPHAHLGPYDHVEIIPKGGH